MNLQEDIDRIKEVMGINESSQITLVKRRLDDVIDYVEAANDWLRPDRFSTFDNFLERVVISATRDFIADVIKGDHDEQLKIQDELVPKILELVKKHSIYDEIYDHWISN